VAQTPYYSGAVVTNNQQQIPFEKAEDINELAFKTLQQRTLKEIGKTLSRLAVKKIAEYSVRAAAKDNNGNNNSLLQGIGYGIQLYSLLLEKADTRNWQTLPSYISYARIPLQKGENQISLTLKNSHGADEIKTIKVNGTGRLQFYNYPSLR